MTEDEAKQLKIGDVVRHINAGYFGTVNRTYYKSPFNDGNYIGVKWDKRALTEGGYWPRHLELIR